MLASLLVVAYGCRMPTRTKGDEVRRLREEAGLTGAELARRLGFNKGYLFRIENGAQHGSPKTRLRIAKALGSTTSTTATSAA
jgi:transcriptional regulator with XRE-family HTH domain